LKIITKSNYEQYYQYLRCGQLDNSNKNHPRLLPKRRHSFFPAASWLMFGAGVGVKEISGKSLGFFVAFAKFTKLTKQKHD